MERDVYGFIICCAPTCAEDSLALLKPILSLQSFSMDQSSINLFD